MLPVVDHVPAAMAWAAAETVRIRRLPSSARTAWLRHGWRDLTRIAHRPPAPRLMPNHPADVELRSRDVVLENRS